MYFHFVRLVATILIFSGVIASVATDNPINTLTLSRNLPYDPKLEASTLSLIKYAGYPAEDHIVVTDDGYLLTMHRIPNESGSPIFIQHGLLSSSADWLTLGRGKSLPFLLADLGYDVWLGNYRGNSFSSGHVNLSTSDPQYWDFSWHEMGIYDLPAMIDYVTSYKSEKVIYIGHSMGTTGSFVMAAERPDMQDKVRLIIGLAPVAYMTHMASPLRIFATYTDQIERIERVFGIYDFFSRDWIVNFVSKYVCGANILNAKICTNVLFAICGYDPFQMDWDRVTTIASLTPAGASTKCLLHYLQEVVSHKFRQFDYGLVKNIEKYGALTPPDYDISKMRIPMAFFYGDNDWLAAVSDVMELYRKLPNAIAIERVNFSLFNHLDFLWANDAPKLLYEPMIKLIQSVH